MTDMADNRTARVELGDGPGRARDVPEARATMLRDLRMVMPLLVRAKIVGHEGDFADDEHSTVIIDGVEEGDLWFVEPAMMDVLDHAVETMPPATLTEDLIPSGKGVVFFGRPLVGKDADDPDIEVIVHALQWFFVRLTVLDGWAISIVAYSHFAHGWVPLGRTDWPLGWDTEGVALDPENRTQQRLASQSEDRRLLAALWLLAAQKRVAEVRVAPEPVNKAVRRKWQAMGSPQVRVVDVRRPAAPRDGLGFRTDGVTWSHRWIVEGHWRQQAWGPGRQYRRPLFIGSYVKGPADKPLVITERVKRIV